MLMPKDQCIKRYYHRMANCKVNVNAKLKIKYSHIESIIATKRFHFFFHGSKFLNILAKLNILKLWPNSWRGEIFNIYRSRHIPVGLFTPN